MFNSGIANWVFHNQSTIQSDGFPLLVGGGMTTINIEITGDASSATLIFEGKAIDNGNFYPVKCVDISTYEMANSTSNIGSIWQVNVSALISFRVRISNIADNSITVKGRVVETAHVLASATQTSIIGSLTKLTTEADPLGQEGWTLLIIDKTVTPPTSTVKIYHNGIWEAF